MQREKPCVDTPLEHEKTNCMWGTDDKYGDIVNFNNKAAINTGKQIDLWDGTVWTILHDEAGHPAHFFDGTFLVGKADTVEYFNSDGNIHPT